MRAPGIIVIWLLAVLIATLLGSIVQTQFNLAALASLGVDISTATRLRATAHDLAGFTPLYGAVIAACYVIALPLAALLARRWPTLRTGLYVLAGGLSILAALLLMAVVMPITPVAAARSASGLLALAACGIVAGWVFARLLSGADSTQNHRRADT
ncbi:MAG: hypothetical protein JJU27_06995 [Gammaproteobacteria bacterium]|nr:hypothetical protein [Gammaproteobacteria bacterium]